MKTLLEILEIKTIWSKRKSPSRYTRSTYYTNGHKSRKLHHREKINRYHRERLNEKNWRKDMSDFSLSCRNTIKLIKGRTK